MQSKPLAKSLHTVSVLVAVAQQFRPVDAGKPAPVAAVEWAAAVLGYTGAADPYGLKAAAVRKLEKEA